MINYYEYQPCAALSPYIKCYWTLKAQGSGFEKKEVMRMVPDGHVEWSFHLQSSFDVKFKGQHRQESKDPHFFGQFKGFVDLHFPSGSYELFCIKFHPWAAHLFWPEPMSYYSNQTVQLEDAFPEIYNQLWDGLQEEADIGKRIKKVEEILISIQKDKLDQRLVYVFMQMASNRPGLSQQLLSDELGISKRRIEQIFLDKIGLPPKSIHRIFRMRQAMNYMLQNPQAPLTQVAYKFHFFDQSHFSHEFKSFTGFSPKRFRQKLYGDKSVLSFHPA